MERIRTALALWIILALWFVSPSGAPAATVPTNGGSPTPSPTDAQGQPPSPAIRLSPDFGSPGDTITVSGSEFTPLAGLSIYWARTSPGPMIPRPIVSTVGADGSFSLSFTVPPSGAGAHTITALDAAGLQASAAFRIIPALALSPDSGAPGDTITIEGNGFTPSAGITIRWDQSAAPVESILGTAPIVGPDGSFSLSFTVPPSGAGTHTITARDSAGLEAGSVFTVRPPTASLALAPSAGAPGDLVKVSGSGFAPSQAISLYWDGAALTPDDAATYESGVLLTAGSTIRTDKDGSFAVSLRVPKGASPGTHTIVARDATGLEAGASFEIREPAGEEIIPPAIGLSPSSGLAGDTVAINGIGFAPLASVSLSWDGGLLPLPNPIRTDANGAFAASFSVPEASAGYHTARALDEMGREASAVFFLRTVSGAAAISADPIAGLPGDSVQITGTGFAPSSSLALLWDGTPIPDGKTLTAGADGAFSATITVPPAAAGPHTISARSGTGIEATTGFYVRAPAGSGVALVLGSSSGMPGETITISGSGFGAERTVSLDWDESIPLGALATDASGAFSGTITVPDTAAGFHLISASDPELGLRVQSVFIMPGTAGPAGPAGPPGEPCSGCGPTAATTGLAGAALVLAAVALGLIVLGKLKRWTIG